MNLRIQIEEKYKASIKSKNVEAVNTLRLIKSAIKDTLSKDTTRIKNQFTKEK